MKRILIAIRLTLIPIPPSGPPPWSSVPEWGNAITIIMNEHIVPFIIRIISLSIRIAPLMFHTGAPPWRFSAGMGQWQKI